MNSEIRCIIVDDEPVAREILENHLSRIKAAVLVGSCRNAIEAFNIINEKAVDLVFLDINMPEISGLSFARSINRSIKVIFITAYREYAVDGFDLQAVDYLLKPVSFERFLQAIHKYINEELPPLSGGTPVPSTDTPDCFFVRSERKMVKICPSDILYIESLGDYVRFHLKDRNILTRETISATEQRLNPREFIRIHRSFIVSKIRIDSYTSEYVEVDKKQLTISRGYRDEVMGKLGE